MKESQPKWFVLSLLDLLSFFIVVLSRCPNLARFFSPLLSLPPFFLLFANAFFFRAMSSGSSSSVVLLKSWNESDASVGRTSYYFLFSCFFFYLLHKRRLRSRIERRGRLYPLFFLFFFLCSVADYQPIYTGGYVSAQVFIIELSIRGKGKKKNATIAFTPYIHQGVD